MPRRQSKRDEAAFRQRIADARAAHNISDVVARHTKVVRAGREKVALCLHHSERSPSMRLNDAKGTYHCFGCGVSGDVITLVMHLEGCSFGDALSWLGAADLPIVDPAQRIQAAAEEAAERAAAIARARLVWDKAAPAHRTPAHAYLRSRGITIAPPPSLRFAMTPAWYDDETGECGADLPALVAAVTVEGDPCPIGLQRIFIAAYGSGKAAMSKPKRSLGRIKGGAVRIAPVSADRPHEVIVTEGPEDALSIAQDLPGREVWAALGTALMIEAQYPARVTSIVIAGQNDEPGRAAVDKATAGLVERGFSVRAMWPADRYKDWNDQLRGIRC